MSPATYDIVAPSDVALTPPPGVIPDFQDPFSLRPYDNVAGSMGLVLSGFFLILRIYTKLRIVKEFRFEDYACIIAFLCYCGWASMEFEVINAKGGTHQWNVTKQELSEQYRFTNYSDIIYSPAVAFCKLSIIFLVLRLFCPQIRDRFYWVLQGLNFLNTTYYAIFFFIPIFSCKPRRKAYHPEESGKCLNIFALYISSAVINTLSDMAMFFVPLWRIWHLRISRSRKLGISGIFVCGGMAIISSILRLYFCILLLKQADYSYTKAQSSIWTHGELAFGIMSSCLFILPRLYRHLASIPPYGSDDYDEYQRRKPSQAMNREKKGSKTRTIRKQGSEFSIGRLNQEIEGPLPPPVPPKSRRDSREDSPKQEEPAWVKYWNSFGGRRGSPGSGKSVLGNEMSDVEKQTRFGDSGLKEMRPPFRKGVFNVRDQDPGYEVDEEADVPQALPRLPETPLEDEGKGRKSLKMLFQR